MRAPTIHSNGDCYDELYNPVVTAARSLDEALLALTALRPHGRNYYVQNTATGEDASCVAYDQWRKEFILPLQEMRDNLNSLRQEIYKQRPKKEKAHDQI